MTFLIDLLFVILSDALGGLFLALLTTPVTVFTEVLIALLTPT